MQKIAGDNSLQPAADLQVGDRVLVTLRIESTQGADARDTPVGAITFRDLERPRHLVYFPSGWEMWASAGGAKSKVLAGSGVGF